jgi:ribosomal protein S12 methylthiotransferase
MVADVPGIEWVRLMYAFPARFPHDLLPVISQHPHVCPYLDLPIQHVADRVLKSMQRGISRRGILELLDSLRSAVPNLTLRTTLIVGYPAEGTAEFDELLAMVAEGRFDRLGVFTYSHEEGTAAFGLGDPVSSREKERRRSLIMEAQQGISLARNEMLIGTRQRVLLDRVEKGIVIGRTAADAPEIDHEVFVSGGRGSRAGDFVDVDIVDATEYDAFGEVPEGGRDAAGE